MNFQKIEAVDLTYSQRAQKRWDNLIKPKGSLGRLEEIVCRLAAIQRNDHPHVEKKRLIVFAADHGIVEEGVSAYPQEVTRQMVQGFLRGHAAICILAKRLGIELQVVDVGIVGEVNDPDLICVPVGSGTKNFLREPAMSKTEAEKGISAGIDFARRAQADGIHLIAGGDMGIGNTTSASAIYAALFDLPPEQIAGFGAGLDNEGRQKKIIVIKAALEKWNVSSSQALEILQHFGGFEIACLTGLYLGAAIARIAVVVDGFICTAAAAIALKLAPAVGDYLFFSHHSAEKGTDLVFKELGVQPLLHLNMRLGEGSGAALAMHLFDDAIALYDRMLTFEEASVSRDQS